MSQKEVLSFVSNNLKIENGTNYVRLICPTSDPKKVYIKPLQLPTNEVYNKEFADKIEAKGLTEVNELIQNCQNYKEETKDQEPFLEFIYKDVYVKSFTSKNIDTKTIKSSGSDLQEPKLEHVDAKTIKTNTSNNVLKSPETPPNFE